MVNIGWEGEQIPDNRNLLLYVVLLTVVYFKNLLQSCIQLYFSLHGTVLPILLAFQFTSSSSSSNLEGYLNIHFSNKSSHEKYLLIFPLSNIQD